MNNETTAPPRPWDVELRWVTTEEAFARVRVQAHTREEAESLALEHAPDVGEWGNDSIVDGDYEIVEVTEPAPCTCAHRRPS